MKKGSIFLLFLGVTMIFMTGMLWAEGPSSQGGNFAIEHFVINEGTTELFGATYIVMRSNVGDAVIGVVVSPNPDDPVYAVAQGFSYFRLFIPPHPDYEYDIDEIFAEEYSGGNAIFETIWQNDPDPFFHWAIKEPDLEVLGYSLSFDQLPDEFVDAVDPEYQTPDFYLTDGVHYFYVVAKNTGGNFGAPGSFEIWVDATKPEIASALPENGSIVSQPRPAIQVVLFDETSGIDASTIKFTITTELDQYTESGVYDAQSGLAVYVPSEDYPDGLVTVSLAVSDQAGNPAIPLFWSFTIDTTEPEGWLLINDDDPVTETTDVSLALFASEIISEVAEMFISNEEDLSVGTWEPYAIIKPNWVLPGGEGIKTVYVKFKDSGGNESIAYSDSILLLMAVPNTFITAGPESLTSETTASFAFTSTIDNSSFQYKFDNADWSEFSTESTVTFNDLSAGNHYFQVRAGIDLDNNGTIEVDEIDPSPASVSWTIGTLSTVPFEAKQPIRYYKEE